MSGFQQQTTRRAKRQKTQPEETNTASDPNSDMIAILKLLEWEFKITMIYILRACYDFLKLTFLSVAQSADGELQFHKRQQEKLK